MDVCPIGAAALLLSQILIKNGGGFPESPIVRSYEALPFS